MRGVTVTILSLSALFLLSIYLANQASLYAHTVEPSLQEFTLTPGEEVEGSFTFTNEEDQEISIVSKAYAYNPKNKTVQDQQPFVKVLTETTFIKPGEKAEIKYKVKVPDNLDLGTHFNVISNEEQIESQASENLGLKPGIGELIVLHVVQSKEGDSLEKSFLNNSYFNLTVLDKGFPFIKPTRLEVKYSNNTNYVFHPTGELRLIELKPIKIRSTLRFNPDAKAVYPGESLTEVYEINAWEFDNSLKSMSSIARIQLINGSSPIEARTDFSIKNQFYSSIFFATILLCGSALLYTKKVKRSRSSK